MAVIGEIPKSFITDTVAAIHAKQAAGLPVSGKALPVQMVVPKEPAPEKPARKAKQDAPAAE